MLKKFLEKEKFLGIHLFIRICLLPFAALFFICKSLLLSLKKHLAQKTNIFERLFIISILSLFILTVNPWLQYTILFDAEYSFYHKVYTDEFLILFVCILCALLPFFINFFLTDKDSHFSIGWIILFYIIRIVSLSVISFIFILSLQNPEIISLNKSAKFTWQFFVFGFVLIFAWILGMLGLQNFNRLTSNKE